MLVSQTCLWSRSLAMKIIAVQAPRSGLPEEDPAEPPHRDYRFLMWFMDETLQVRDSEC